MALACGSELQNEVQRGQYGDDDEAIHIIRDCGGVPMGSGSSSSSNGKDDFELPSKAAEG